MARYNDLNGDGRATQSRVGQIVGVETTLFAIAVLLYILRIFSRIRPVNKLSYDDYFITLGVVSIRFGFAPRC